MPETSMKARTRFRLLRRIEAWMELPMVLLGALWLVLLIVELTRGLTPLLQALATAIWVLFIGDFALKLVLAPRKLAYLRSNWLTLVALLVPALRILRIGRALLILRAGRAARTVRLFRLITSVNRGMAALGSTMRRRGFGYVLVLTCMVSFASAAGMYAFERNHGLDTYGAALWWTAMMMTTAGSDYWPRSTEGRVLCLLIALYAFAVFGYITATIATFFIGRDAQAEQGGIAGQRAVDALRAEVADLKGILRELTSRRP